MTRLTGKYIRMSSAHVEFKVGDDISTTFLNNGATLGTSGFHALDVLGKVSFTAQVPRRIRAKKSGVGNYQDFEGVLDPVELKFTCKCNCGIPLSWVHACSTTGGVHTMTIPLIDQPTSAATALPKLGFRVEGEASDTNAKEIIDFIGCVVTELQLTIEESGVAEWNVTCLVAWVLRGQTKISSPATDPATAVYAWGHFAQTYTFTYGGVAVGLALTGITATWRLGWKPIENGIIATTYRVYQSFLLESWNYNVELRGKPYGDGTAINIRTILSTALASLSALLFQFIGQRTATTDTIEYQCSLLQPETGQEALSLDRTSDGFEELTVKLETKADYAITAEVNDALAEAFYENTA